MAKELSRKLAEQIREESERTKHDPYPDDVVFTQPNRDRSRVYTVRLSESEYQELNRVAEAAHLPPSTLVRSWILDKLAQERSA